MNPPPVRALTLAHPVIRGLTILNLVYIAGLVALLIAGLLAPDAVFDALGVRDGEHRLSLIAGMRAMMIVGIAGAVVVDRVLRQLLAIIDSVRAGDPFIAGNAARLQAIAWWVLAGEVLRLVISLIAWAASTEAQALDVDVGFSFAPWLAVLMLFVLAQVFAEGTRMRSDLEGTV